MDRDEKLTRRRILATTLAAPLGATALSGCGGLFFGGSGGSGSSGGGTLARVRVRPQVTLPPSLGVGQTALVSAFTTLSPLTANPSIEILEDGPSVVSLLEPASGRLIMVALLRPAEPAPVINAERFAEALLFVVLGGWQRRDRDLVVQVIRNHSATAALATTIQARLDLDAFALENRDPVLLAALQTAAESVGPALPDSSESVERSPRPSETFSRSRSLPEPPEPHVAFQLGAQGIDELLVDQVAVRLRRVYVGDGLALPDMLTLGTDLPIFHRLHFFNLDPSGQPQSGEAATLSHPGSSLADPSTLGPFTLPNLPEDAEASFLVLVRPLFESGIPSILNSPQFVPIRAQIEASLFTLRQMTAFRFACDFLLEGLGFGGARYTLAALEEAFAVIKQGDPEVISALAVANEGGMLEDAVTRLILAMTSTTPRAELSVLALKKLIPASGSISALQTVAAQRLIAFVGEGDFLSLTAQFGPRFRAHKGSFGFEPVVERSGMFRVSRVAAVVTGPSQYQSGSSPIELSLAMQPDSYFSEFGSVALVKWKLFGAGDGVLDDGDGKMGKEFESRKDIVKFRPAANSTGVQSVGAELFIAYGDIKRATVQAKLELNEEGGTSAYSLVSSKLYVEPGKTGQLIVAQNSNSTLAGWTGVNTQNLRFVWELENSQVGLLSSGSATGQTLETTTNQVGLVVTGDTECGKFTPLKVTVKLVDPSTGQFTNLAVLTGFAEVGPGLNAQFVHTGGTLVLSTLANPTVIRNLVRRRGSITLQNNQVVLGGEYDQGRDTLLLGLSLPTDLEAGTSFQITGNNSAFLDLWKPLSSGVYNFDLSGQGVVTQLTKFPDGTPKYVAVNLNLSGVDPTSGATLNIQAASSFGSP